jgi:hypothetical protein
MKLNWRNTMQAETIQERLDKKVQELQKLDAEIQVLRADLKLINDVAQLKANDVIMFRFGRKDNRQDITATVLGVYDTEKGRRIKVFYGEGLEADTKTIKPGDVMAVRGKPTQTSQCANDNQYGV